MTAKRFQPFPCYLLLLLLLLLCSAFFSAVFLLVSTELNANSRREQSPTCVFCHTGPWISDICVWDHKTKENARDQEACESPQERSSTDSLPAHSSESESESQATGSTKTISIHHCGNAVWNPCFSAHVVSGLYTMGDHRLRSTAGVGQYP